MFFRRGPWGFSPCGVIPRNFATRDLLLFFRVGLCVARPFGVHRCARTPDRHSERAVGRDRTRSVTQVKSSRPNVPPAREESLSAFVASAYRVGTFAPASPALTPRMLLYTPADAYPRRTQ